MSFFERLLQALGFTRASGVTFHVDADLLPSLNEVAEQEQRSAEEVATELLVQALNRRTADYGKLGVWENLTPRQQQVAALTCLGYTNDQIGAKLHISSETVKTHVRNVLHKYDVRSKSQLRRLLRDWDFRDWDD